MENLSNIPENLRYTKEHEWIKIDKGIATIGITDYAQHSLTDIVFVELPEVGKKVMQFSQFCVVESVKSVSDVFAPISGEISEVNKALIDKPELINQEPYDGGWIAKINISNISGEKELSLLMDSVQYQKYLEGMKK